MTTTLRSISLLTYAAILFAGTAPAFADFFRVSRILAFETGTTRFVQVSALRPGIFSCKRRRRFQR